MNLAQPYQQQNENALWYPYVQMAQLELPGQVVGASGSQFFLEDGTELIDAISSWWCVIHGYNHPEINEAAKDQIDTLSHVMMGGLSHPWSRKLADKLVEISPETLNHVFFADSGSVGVEVALKMALQYWYNQSQEFTYTSAQQDAFMKKRKFACLRNGYHGDTFGAMSVGEPDDAMQIAFPELLMKPYFVHPPGFEKATLPNSDEVDSASDPSECEKVALDSALHELRELFENHGHELAAFICEPIMQGYGGFHVYDPVYLKELRRLCDQYDVLMIVDEVATGLGRTGAMFAVDHADVSPDIMIVSKALTAGYLGMSATLASTKVFNAFWGQDSSKAFMHGPTFMGNALACRIALKSVELLEREWVKPTPTSPRSECTLNSVQKVEGQLRRALSGLEHADIKSIRILGAMATIEVHDASSIEGIADYAKEHGVWLRPIGPFLYTMPPFNISKQDLQKILQVMTRWFMRETDESSLEFLLI